MEELEIAVFLEEHTESVQRKHMSHETIRKFTQEVTRETPWGRESRYHIGVIIRHRRMGPTRFYCGDVIRGNETQVCSSAATGIRWATPSTRTREREQKQGRGRGREREREDTIHGKVRAGTLTRGLYMPGDTPRAKVDRDPTEMSNI